jgi:hypothetical protein
MGMKIAKRHGKKVPGTCETMPTIDFSESETMPTIDFSETAERMPNRIL